MSRRFGDRVRAFESRRAEGPDGEGDTIQRQNEPPQILQPGQIQRKSSLVA